MVGKRLLIDKNRLNQLNRIESSKKKFKEFRKCLRHPGDVAGKFLGRKVSINKRTTMANARRR